MNIAQVKQTYGLSAKVLAQPGLLNNDDYHNSISRSAKEMVSQNKEHFIYETQWVSGTCLWNPPQPVSATYVIASGPEPCQNKHGDEYPIWQVMSCDDDDIVITTFSYSSRDEALSKGESMARKLNVEFVNDAGFA